MWVRSNSRLVLVSNNKENRDSKGYFFCVGFDRREKNWNEQETEQEATRDFLFRFLVDLVGGIYRCMLYNTPSNW